jgi:hypothetical protein
MPLGGLGKFLGDKVLPILTYLMRISLSRENNVPISLEHSSLSNH